MKTTVLIVDDHRLIREAWSIIINASLIFTVIAECSSGEEAVELALKLRPDIVLMDINMPGIDGIEATQQIRKYSPKSKILGVSSHTHHTYIKKMIRKGASGYITKTSSTNELFFAMSETLVGKKYICHEIKDLIAEQAINKREASIYSLTAREMEIINCVKEGDSSKEIAVQLHLSTRTVEVHRFNILKKLNLTSATALVNYFNAHMAN
jgi:DNA-binding NarL/FixJ family response regulator